jgi:hypothetical protein
LHNAPFCPISAKASLSCRRQAQISARSEALALSSKYFNVFLRLHEVKRKRYIFAFLELEQNWTFFKGLLFIFIISPAAGRIYASGTSANQYGGNPFISHNISVFAMSN